MKRFLARPLGRRFAMAVIGAGLLTGASAQLASADGLVVGVSWSNFQEERWKTDEAAIKAVLDAAGAKYISADAQSNPSKQLSDIESLIAGGANALIVLAQDSASIGPAITAAANAGIPVVGYDRLIEDPSAYYLTFDNKEVGRMQAAAVFAAQPKGNYVFIKGNQADPNADFLHEGQLEVLKEAIDKGDIKVVGEQYTENWEPAVAQRNMEQILTANDNKVDAVVQCAGGKRSQALMGSGDGGFLPSPRPLGQGTALLLGDVNADMKPDLLILDSGLPMQVLLNTRK